MTALVVAATLLAADAGATRVLVLPVRHGKDVSAESAAALEQRVLVALQTERTLAPVGRVDVQRLAEAQRLQDLLGCSDEACLGQLGALVNVEQILAGELLRNEAGMSFFATLYAAATAKPLRRREFRNLSHDDLAHSLASEVAAWTAGSEVRETRRARLAVVRPNDGVARSVVQALAGELATLADPSVEVVTVEAGALAHATHRLEVTVAGHDVVYRLHHMHHYYDGSLVATLAMTEIGSGKLVFAKQVTVAASARARYSSREQVVSALVSDAAAQWLNALRDQGVLATLAQRAP